MRRIEPEYVPSDERVPPLSAWPQAGISGKVTVGEHDGRFVLARRIPPGSDVYVLYLPVDELFDDAGRLAAEDNNVDRMVEARGGIIDDVTRVLGVVWSTDIAQLDAATNWYLFGI
jgi:hypothetical protein